MTVDDDSNIILVIGGFSSKQGFSNKMILEYNLSNKRWKTLIPIKKEDTGTLLGIYGHSTVYHAQTQSFYVYGGITYSIDNGISKSNQIYKFHYPTKIWSPVSIYSSQALPQHYDSMLSSSRKSKPPKSIFHSAVTFDKYMVIVGGKQEQQIQTLNSEDRVDKQGDDEGVIPAISLYIYRCNLWINIYNEHSFVEMLGNEIDMPIAGGAGISQDGIIYIMGGLSQLYGIPLSTLVRLNLPKDACGLYSSNQNGEMCKTTLGCAHCSVFDGTGNNSTFCYSNNLEKPRSCKILETGQVSLSDGVSCEGVDHTKTLETYDCNEFKSCEECLPTGPREESERKEIQMHNSCIWCPECETGNGKCIHKKNKKDLERCSPRVHDPFCNSNVGRMIEVHSKCPKSACQSYFTCNACLSVLESVTDGNIDTDSKKRSERNNQNRYNSRNPRMTKDNEARDGDINTEEYKRQKPLEPISRCDWKKVGKGWRCMENEPWPDKEQSRSKDNVTTMTLKTAPAKLELCPLKCFEYKECKSCLSSFGGGDGHWTECYWSIELRLCLSPPHIPLRCLGGVCGTLFSTEGKYSNNMNRSEIAENICPKPCSSFTQCKSCLENTRCGWCSLSKTNGGGKCIDGTIEGPINKNQCEHSETNKEENEVNPPTQQDHSSKKIKNSGINSYRQKIIDESSWHYNICPPENECLNGHHNCDIEAEVCIDEEHGFTCNCSAGYERSFEGNIPKKCSPVCNPKCDRGKCVAPNKCDCDFSYVGLTCNISCNCNGHSDCAGPDPAGLNRCLECRNNTMGARCEFCRPFFVGDPRNGSKCVSCSDYCNGHSDFCFDPSLLNSTSLSVPPVPTLSIRSSGSNSTGAGKLTRNVMVNSDVEDLQEAALLTMAASISVEGENGARILDLEDRVLNIMISYANTSHGPRDEGAVCVNCDGDTTGLKCDRCASGHYRKSGDKRKPCKPCDCNGHGEICNAKTGESCLCQNNTISDIDHCRRRRNKHGKEGDHPFLPPDLFTSSSKSSDSSCQRYQCSKCKEYYVGSPTDSHQCYRQMTVDTDYCLDPKTQSKCYAGGLPAPLEHGQTVYFAVLPKFMNVDIRVVVDVTEGNVDVFFSPEPQMFIVNTNKKTWEHEVYLDPQFSYHVSKDGLSHMVYQGNYDNLWHHDYYDTDPLFKLIKEKEKSKTLNQRKVNKIVEMAKISVNTI